jgi:hypothetical protein
MTDDGSAAPETITFLVDARGRPLTKSFRQVAGKLVKGAYPSAAEFRAVAVPVNEIESLAAALAAVANDGMAAAIRGAPGRFYPTNGAPAFRLLYPQEGLVAARTGARIPLEKIRKENLKPDDDTLWAVTWLPMFEDAPRHWAIFDVDRVLIPEHLADDWVDEPEEAVGCVRELLPEPFRAATCWWCLSSSAAIPEPTGRAVSEVFKLKLAFWLDHALLSREIKSWMAPKRRPLIQPCSSPRSLSTSPDRRWTARTTPCHVGSAYCVAKSIRSRCPRCCRKWIRRTTTRAGGRKASSRPKARGLVEQIRARLHGEPHVRQHLMAAARSYFAQHGATVAQAPLVAALEAVAGEFRSPGEVAGYGVDRMVAYAATQTRSATWRPFAAIARRARLAVF